MESDDGACRHGTCDTEWAFFSDGTAGPQWVQRMEREEHKRREARTKISEELLIETLRDKVNELETKIDDIHNFMHSEAVVTLLPGVTLRVDEATQTDREDEEWKGSRGPARRGSNESAIAEP